MVDKLLTCPAAGDLRELAETLQGVADDCELRCIACGGPGPRAGRTSLLLTLARILSEELSVRVALVEGRADKPGFATALSLPPTVASPTPQTDPADDLSAACVELSNQLLIAPAASGADGQTRWPALVRTLRSEFDLVLIDAGTWGRTAPPPALDCRAIDAWLSITRAGTPDTQDELKTELTARGIVWLGEIENFVTPPAGPA